MARTSDAPHCSRVRFRAPPYRHRYCEPRDAHGFAAHDAARATASRLGTSIDRIIDDWRPAQLVVGVPEGDGAEAVARRARAFAAALAERYELPVATVDETLTSVAAETELAENADPGIFAAASARAASIAWQRA